MSFLLDYIHFTYILKQILYTNIIFDNIQSDEDIYWSEKRERIDELDDRINIIKEYLLKRNETKIAIISHGSWIGKLKDNHISYQENGDAELKHCYPYEYKL